LAGDFLTRPATVTVGRVGNVPATISQSFIQVEKREKMKMLIDILTHGEPQRTLVFARTKVMVDTLDRVLAEKQFPVTSIHGDRSQEEREDALNAFKMNITPLMIATDVAARGLDIPNVNHIINYDMPKSIDDYIHRIGRTARVGNEGKSTSFFDPFDDELLTEKLLSLLNECKQPIPEFLRRDVDMRE
jgi:superfamily II DNA/RNA helicase